MTCTCGTVHEGYRCPNCGRGTSGWNIFRILLTVVIGIALVAVAAVASCGVSFAIASSYSGDDLIVVAIGVGVVVFCLLCVGIYRLLRHMNRPRDVE